MKWESSCSLASSCLETCPVVDSVSKEEDLSRVYEVLRR